MIQPSIKSSIDWTAETILQNFARLDFKDLIHARTRGKEKLEQLPCEHFLQAFEIYRALLRAKQVGEKRGKIQKPVKIAHKAVVLIF